ncbi:hypothetical protein [Paraburkholderia hospita]|uniref:hypothetical protein n=1 Tax=Paraburkholderia hospita TaxID=169430 RepID=UPI00131A3695|nr:hypothetical protein [Paraburkholderia hospita]
MACVRVEPDPSTRHAIGTATLSGQHHGIFINFDPFSAMACLHAQHAGSADPIRSRAL